MPVWINSRMTAAFFDETPASEDEECIVRIEGDTIEISYDDEEGNVIYKGKNDGCGHFVLKCPERSGDATLHMFKDTKFLDEYWIEGGNKGFWRIELRK